MTDYSGPEQRENPQGGRRTSDICTCHLKHTAILEDHDSEITEIKADVKVLEAELVGRLKDRVSRSDTQVINQDLKDIGVDLKSKVSMKLFIVCVMIFVGMSGFIYNQLHIIDKQVATILAHQESARSSMSDSTAALQRTMFDLQGQIRDLQAPWSKP